MEVQKLPPAPSRLAQDILDSRLLPVGDGGAYVWFPVARSGCSMALRPLDTSARGRPSRWMIFIERALSA